MDISCPSGSCVYQNATARPCGPAECTGGVLYGPRQCDAAGVCPAQGAPQSCGNYACLDAMSCRASCSMDQDCAAGNLCVAPACNPALALGDICTDARACDSGVCSCGSADCSVRRCAVAACGCSFAGTDGVCDAGVLNAGLDPDNFCLGSQTCGGAGQCGLPLGVACAADSECNSGQCECADRQCATLLCAAQSCLCKTALADGSACTTANLFNGYKDWGDCDAPDDGCVNGTCNHNVGMCTCSGGAVSVDNCNMYFASCEDPLPGMCTCTLL